MNEQKLESFEEYCARKGISAELPDVSSFPEELRTFMTSAYKLIHICKAANGDWRADWTDHDQRKWFPWYVLERNEDNPAGVAARSSAAGLGRASSSLVSRLCLENREDCDYIRDNFTNLWIEFLNG